MNHLAHLGDGVFRWVAQTTWQAAVLAIMILLAQGLLRKRLSPGWRYGLWLLLVARLLMPAMPPSAFSIFNLARPAPKHVFAVSSPPTRIGSSPSVDVNYFNGTPQMPVPDAAEQPEDAILQRPLSVMVKPGVREIINPVPFSKKIEWPNILFWGWLAGVCFFGSRLFWTNARFRSRLHSYQPLADENVMRLFDECRAALNITQPVRLIESDEVESPSVYGLRRKWLLLPDGVFERFSAEELRCIFLHELAHIKRGDLGVNWVVAVLQVLHWFNPVLWLAWARMRADREVATDALALSHVPLTDRVPYGETILKVLAGLTGARALPGSVGIVESKAQLKERLIAISRPGKTWKWAAVAAFVLIAGLGLTRAQTEKTPLSENKPLPQDATNVDFLLSKDALTGTVVMPDGQPAAGAVVGLFYDCNQAEFELNSKFGFTGRAVSCKADAHGHFALEPASRTKWLAAELSNEFTSMRVESFVTSRVIRLKPFDPAAARRARDLELTQELIRAVESRLISGKVVDPSGHSVGGAQVALMKNYGGLHLTDTHHLFNPKFGHVMGVEQRHLPWNYCTTDAQGRFSLDDFQGTLFLLAAQDSGFARVETNEFSTNMTVKLEGWGRIEGTLWYYDQVVTNQAVSVRAGTLRDDSNLWSRETNTDDHGRFTFDFVPPGPIAVFSSTIMETALVKPGQTSVVKVGGRGRPVTGKFKIRNPYVPIEWAKTGDFYYFSPIRPPAKPFQTREDFEAWRNDPEVKRQMDNNKNHGLTVQYAKDGSFRMDQVEPGTYEMVVALHDPRDPTKWIGGFDGYKRTFEIPASKANTREPLDLGVIEISLKPQEAGIGPSGAQPTHQSNAASNQETEEISGRIVDAGGQPVSGVQVAVVKSNATVDLGIGKSRLFNPQVPHLFGEPRLATLPWNYCTTDAQGRFYLNDLAGAFYLLAAHEKGYAEIATNQFSTDMTITLEPWGRIEGTLRYYDEVVSNDTVSIRDKPASLYPHRPSLDRYSTFKTGTDNRGHYAFDFVRPGQYEVFGSGARGSAVRERAAINANETTVRNIGGQGRPVIGKFKVRNPYIPIDWGLVSLNLPEFGFCYFCTEPTMPTEPFKSRQDYLAWRKRREVDCTLDNNDHGREVRIAKDGSFRIDQVEPGKYEVDLSLRDPRQPINRGLLKFNVLAEYDGYDRTFEIPASDPKNREPLDLGVIEISLKPQEPAGKQ